MRQRETGWADRLLADDGGGGGRLWSAVIKLLLLARDTAASAPASRLRRRWPRLIHHRRPALSSPSFVDRGTEWMTVRSFAMKFFFHSP